MASEVSAQKFVHTLEHGKGRWWIYFLLILVVAIYQVVAFLFINPLNVQGGRQEMFRGISHAKGMEQAVIARELMRGHGFSTTIIKPAAIAQVERTARKDPALDSEKAFTKFMDPTGPTKGHIPDFFHAPLHPWLNSLALAAAVKMSDKLQTRVNAEGQPDFWAFKPNEFIHPGDRVIAALAVVFFLLGVLVNYYTLRNLFDRRLSVLVLLMTLFCDRYWDFCGSGLPQMLLFLLTSLGIHCYLRALAARENQRPPWLWLGLTALCFSLMTQAHGLAAFPFIGLILHAALVFRPHGLAPGIMLAIGILIALPWMLRTASISGAIGGIAGQTRLFQIRGTESQIMRTLEKAEEQIEPTNFRGKLQTQTVEQISGLTGHLGRNLIAPFFFLALFHNFKRRDARSLRWAIFLMWLAAVLGMSFFGFSDYDLQARLQSNDLHVLFIPFFLAYGLSILLMAWSRFEIQGRQVSHIRVFNSAFLTALVALNSLPLLGRYTDPPRIGFEWPPYFPAAIHQFNDWYTERDIICSDMPWATAWYADRKSLWLPLTISDFNDLNDYRFDGRINGLLFTPVTGYRGLLSDVAVGEYKAWQTFIMRDPRAATNFPLKVARPIVFIGAAHYLLFADRDRWTERNN